MKQITKKFTIAAVLGSVFMLNIQQASAVTIDPNDLNTYTLTFDDLDNQGGTLNYDENTNGILVGTDILLDTIINDSSEELKIVNGKLNFTTGSLSNYSEVGQRWDWNAGGEFTLTGQLIDQNDNPITVEDYTIFSGSFNNPTSNPYLLGSTFNALGSTELSPELVDFMGIDTDNEQILSSFFTTTEIAIEFTPDENGYFNAQNKNAQGIATTVTLKIGASSVPSGGATIVMFIVGVSCLGFLRNRSFSKN